MSAISEFGLVADPFSTTVNDFSIHHWAGREREKQLLLDVIESVRMSDIGSTEFVVVHGEYGAGKSHALRYLATQINEDRRSYYKGHAIYLRTVRVSEKVRFLDVYKSILGQLGKAFIQNVARHVAQQVHTAMGEYTATVTPERRTELMANQALLVSETLRKWVAPQTIPFVQLLMQAVSNEGVDGVWSYLRGEEEGFEDLGLEARVANDYTAVVALAGLFRAMCAQIGTVAPAYEAIYLLVDEQENLVDMKATESVQLLQSFRELLNQLPANFCMIWGFSADAALIEAVLPSAILQRLTRRYIELPAMQVDEAKRFIREHLSAFRPQGFVNSNPYYPFSEGAIDLALERIIEMTPRNIFKSLRAILERALRRFDLTPPHEISAELAGQIIDLQG